MNDEGRRPISVTITQEQRAILESWVRQRTSPHRLVIRSRIVLLAAEGISDRAIAQRLEIARQTVRLWRRRFLAGGVSALVADAPGRGRKPAISANQIHSALSAAGQRAPSIRELARRLGASPSSTHRSVVKHRQQSSEAARDAAMASQLRNKKPR